MKIITKSPKRLPYMTEEIPQAWSEDRQKKKKEVNHISSQSEI